jgi:hypothetical protein
MQPLSNSADGAHVLRFKFRGSVPNSVLEVGYLKNISDPASFAFLKTYTASSTTNFEMIAADLGIDPTTEVLAFRNPGTPTGIIYIDDVVWEALPTCPDVKALVSTDITGTTAGLTWTTDGSAV